MALDSRIHSLEHMDDNFPWTITSCTFGCYILHYPWTLCKLLADVLAFKVVIRSVAIIAMIRHCIMAVAVL
jgi:hypothetical protein